MPDFQLTWLRALAHVGGPDARPVTATDVARALPRVERVVGRVTAQAAAANLSSLERLGLAEAVWEERHKLWRVSVAGIAALGGPTRPADPPPAPPTPEGDTLERPLLQRLADLVAAYNRGDLAWIDAVIDPEVLVFVPGLNALAGTYSGHGAVIALLHESARYFAPDVEVLEGTEEEGETRVRVRARAITQSGGPVELELWVRARFSAGGHVVQAVLQPEDQEAFDGAVGKRPTT